MHLSEQHSQLSAVAPEFQPAGEVTRIIRKEQPHEPDHETVPDLVPPPVLNAPPPAPLATPPAENFQMETAMARIGEETDSEECVEHSVCVCVLSHQGKKHHL